MPLVIAEGVVEVTADGTDVPKGIARDIEAGQAPVVSAGGITGKNIIKGILASTVVLKTLDWFGGGIQSASDLNETVSKSSIIFGAQYASIDKWSQKSTTALGLSRQEALAAASSFGDMFTQIGFTGEAAAQMSTSVVQAAADLGSFSNLDTADVSDRIAAAFRGEYDSLQAVIPNINAARVEKEALAASGKTLASQLTAEEKAAAVLAIIHEDGARAMGDFARTSDGFANSSKIATAQLSELQAEVGTELLPIMQDLLGFVLSDVIPGFKDVAGWVSKNVDTVGLLAGVIGGTILAYQASAAAMGIYKAFQVASAAATGGLTVAQWALNTAMDANPIGAIITVIGLLVGVIVWVATQTTFFQDAWEVMSGAVVAAWEWLWGILEPIFTQIGVIFTWLYENVISPIITGILIYVGIWAGIFTWLWESVLSPVFTAIGAIFSWLYDNVLYPIFIGVMLYIGIWAAIFTWLWETVISPVFGFIGAIFTWLYETVIVPVVGFIIAYVQTLGAIFSWLYDNVISPVFAAMGVAFNWLWVNVVSPVASFISGALSAIGATVTSVFGGIADFIGSAFQSALSMVKGPLNGIIDLVNGAITSLNGLSVTIPDWVPEVGGQTWGLNLPKIPKLARGTNDAPDAFIAGEAGPELITGAAGATVRPYSVTKDLLAGLGSGGGDIYIDSVVIDAKNVREFNDVVDMVKSVAQVARTGRGQGRMA